MSGLLELLDTLMFWFYAWLVVAWIAIIGLVLGVIAAVAWVWRRYVKPVRSGRKP